MITMNESKDIVIRGLHCADCVKKVEHGLSSTPGISLASLTFATGKLHVEYDPSMISLQKIRRRWMVILRPVNTAQNSCHNFS